MQTIDSRKQGNVAAVLWQLLVPAPGSAEEALERELRELFARMRGADGRVPSKAFYKVAEADQFPLRIIARRIDEAQAAKVPHEDVEQVAHALARYIARRYGVRERLTA